MSYSPQGHQEWDMTEHLNTRACSLHSCKQKTLHFNDDTTGLSTVTSGLHHTSYLTVSRHNSWKIRGQH